MEDVEVWVSRLGQKNIHFDKNILYVEILKFDYMFKVFVFYDLEGYEFILHREVNNYKRNQIEFS